MSAAEVVVWFLIVGCSAWFVGLVGWFIWLVIELRKEDHK